MIAVADIEFRYGREFSLRIDKLEIDSGSAVAFIGPSGTGKTTLLHLLAGILVPDSGTILRDGTVVNGLDDAARRDLRIRTIGLVFQDFELLDYLNVLDNILLPYRLHPSLQLDESVKTRARELASRLGVGDRLHRFPDQLSQGEKQRSALCRALLPRPSLILADEPTGNLDPENKKAVLDLLFDYVSEANDGVTLVTVTHDHELLGQFSRVVDFGEFHEAP